MRRRADRAYEAELVLDCGLIWWAFYDSWPPWARECLTRRLPDEYGLREFIREAGAESDRGPRNPVAFALKAAVFAELALKRDDPRAAQVLREERRDKLRGLHLVA